MKPFSINTSITLKDTESFKKYLRDVSAIELLTPAQELICAEKASNGDQEAINELVVKNLRFVISIAKQYTNYNNKIEDLVNEGNIGLIMAVHRFKPNMGFRFISYAVWWIRKIIMEHINKHGKIIRLPANKINSMSKLDKKIAMLEQKLGRVADISEIFDAFGGEINKDEISLLESLSSFNIESLDREFTSENDSGNLLDVLADESAPEADHIILKQNVKNEIVNILSTLKPRDRRIMTALFGLDGNIPMTLKEVSEEIGVTREMIRQIKEKVLAGLRVKLKNSILITYQN